MNTSAVNNLLLFDLSRLYVPFHHAIPEEHTYTNKSIYLDNTAGGLRLSEVQRMHHVVD